MTLVVLWATGTPFVDSDPASGDGAAIEHHTLELRDEIERLTSLLEALRRDVSRLDHDAAAQPLETSVPLSKLVDEVVAELWERIEDLDRRSAGDASYTAPPRNDAMVMNTVRSGAGNAASLLVGKDQRDVLATLGRPDATKVAGSSAEWSYVLAEADRSHLMTLRFYAGFVNEVEISTVP